MENAPEPLIGSSIPAEEDLPQNSGDLLISYFTEDIYSSRVDIWGNFTEDILEDVLGEVMVEIKRGPPVAAIESEVGDVQPEGAPVPNEGESLRASDEAILAAPLTALPPRTQSETKEGPACGDKK
ncbi:UNVERIFIED_CONTAM: hypothetical protein Slati_2362400 [Sesamum latifolium]|uniref:Uncharacterized protein n=1 Tax=Sesamum latifolium TaxID=2727402 RepID=A0AAW2WBT8_9LAMI